MNFHSLAFRHEQPHLFPATLPPSTNHRALAALLPLAIGLTMAPPGLARYSWWYLSLFVTWPTACRPRFSSFDRRPHGAF